MNITQPARPGIYRRLVSTRAFQGAIRADMEDDSHRFGVVVYHDGRNVVGVESLATRTPWTLCPEARPMLTSLIGMALKASPLAAAAHTDQKAQCTHMFDLAALAIAHAARGIKAREYRIDAPWYELEGPRELALHRDGVHVATWILVRDRLVQPELLAAVGIRPLLAWAANNVSDPDELEALFIMRRAVLISGSRLLDLDVLPTAAATGHGVGACYVHQPVRIELARRNLGATRDFTDDPDGLLEDMRAVTGPCH